MSEGLFYIAINGQRLPDEIESAATYCEYETSDERLTRLEVRFKNALDLAGKRLFHHGDSLDIAFGRDNVWHQDRSLRIHRVARGIEFRVIAYEQSHDMQRVVRSRIWSGVTYSEIAMQIARMHGLQADIETTKMRHVQVAQVNESDLHFLRRLARRIGFECYVQDRTLHFHHTRWEDGPVDTLTYVEGGGGTLVEFYPVENTLAKPGQVTAVGMDPYSKKAYEVAANGRTVEWAALGRGVPQERYPGGATGYRLAIAHDNSQVAKEEAEGLYRIEQGDLVIGEFVAVGRPKIQARMIVEVQGHGPRFDGLYRVQGARHIISGKYVVRGWLVRNGVGDVGGMLQVAPRRNTRHGVTR